jgi:SLA1 homology domain 1, SHD1
MKSSTYKGRIKALIGKDLSGLKEAADAIKANDQRAASEAIARLPWHEEPALLSDAGEGEGALEVSLEASTAKQLLAAISRWSEASRGKVTDNRPVLNPFKMKTGDSGKLAPFVSLNVLQVLGPDSMLVSVGWGTERMNILVENRSTEGVVDGQPIPIPEVFAVTGTKTYETADGGSKTVFTLSPVTGKSTVRTDSHTASTPDPTESYLSEHRSQFSKAVELYTAELGRQRAMLAKVSKDIDTPEELLESIREDIAGSERCLRQITDDPAGFRPVLDLPRTWKVGMIGTMSHNKHRPDEPVSVDVFQVIDERNVLVRFWGDLVWVSGIPTTDLADGRSVTLNQVFRVAGTKRYASTGGSTTVHLVELFDTSRADALLKEKLIERQQAEDEHKRKEAAELSKARTREFTDATGQFKILAEYVGYDNGAVILRRIDNDKEVRLPLGKLSDQDRAWVSAIVRQKK